MSENASSYEAEVEQLVDAYVRHIEGSGEAPDLTLVDPVVAAEATELFRLLDATWGSDIDLPPLDEDPVAVALGLVHPPAANANVFIVGPKAAAARQRRKLRPSEVALRLTHAGHPSTARSVVKLEDASASEVTTGFVDALAEALGCTVTELVADVSADLDAFATWLHSEEFEREVARWAEETSYNGPDLRRPARARLLTARRRSSGLSTPEDWIALLRAVLDSLR